MGVGDWDIDQNPISLGPDFALSAESRVKTVILTEYQHLQSLMLWEPGMPLKYP